MRDFVRWNADGPIAQLIENYISIDIITPENIMTWNLLHTEKMGLRYLNLENITVELLAARE